MDRHRGQRRGVAVVLALFLLLAACSNGGGAPPAGEGDGHGRLREWLEALVPWGFRGAVAVVEQGDGRSEEFASGFGGLEPDTDSAEIDVDTRFGIGSNTKPLTGLAILLLEDRGRLGVDDRLGDLLPAVPEDKAGVTVRQLLTHTAGFESAHGLDEEQIGRAEALDRIFAQPLLFEPGSGSSYSNSGYTLLAAIVEAVSGQDYDDFLQDEIFDPAGMDHSGARGEPVPAGQDEAVGSGADGPLLAPSALSPVGWAIRGNGGVVSSVDDLVALEQTIAEGDLLSDAARRRWNEPLVDLPDGVGEGYGWGFRELESGVRIRAHAGGVPETHHNSLWAYQLDGARTMVASSADGRILAEDVAPWLLRLLEGEDAPEPPDLRPVDPEEMAQVVGTYRSDAGATVTVEGHDDGLRLVSDDGAAFADLFPLPDPVPDIAPPDEVLRLVDSLDDPGYQEWLDQQAARLGAFQSTELVGVAPVDASEPATFLRHHFERGTALSAWVFSPEEEAMSIELEAASPAAMFRPAAEGGFVSFTVSGPAFADGVRFGDNGVMTIHVDGRTVEYRWEG